MANHVFKVGDYLVLKQHSSNNELFLVDRIGRNGEIYDSHWRMLHDEHFRMAEPKEVLAGKRLL